MSVRIITGDCREVLRTLPADSVHCVVTSPPYWGLRDYGVAGQLGLEATPWQFLDRLVEIFTEVRRVLRADGTCWVNMGDCYANDGKFGGEASGKHFYLDDANRLRVGREKRFTGLKPKDLVGMPWRLALALQADGWWLRRDIVWHKQNPMPESVWDRCTTSHEYLFHLTKSERYFYDATAIMEPSSPDSHARAKRGRSANHKFADGGPGDQTIARKSPSAGRFIGRPAVTPKEAGAREQLIKSNARFHQNMSELVPMRNKRSVWTTTSEPFPEAHFATFPPSLIEPCILAGCPGGGLVLDPFGGAGTTGLVADRLGRDAILIELNPKYAEMARRRIHGDAPLFAGVEMRAAE